MKRLLVPIDFSESSLNALILAKHIAKRSEGIIYLLHVIELPTDKYSFLGNDQKEELKNIYTLHFIDIVNEKLNEIKDNNESNKKPSLHIVIIRYR